MNKKIGMFSSIINVIAVFCFAICMLIGSDFGSYFSSMFIAFSFIPMICAYAFFSKENSKVAGFTAIAFSAIYATMM